ncbi:UNVERIFIED_CONTAM: Wound-induced proteinase inhibitor 1 [Sesamum radiatum]|uniref:Wound-induced proteinase inhibitor 1 n=1 Tax=Sesamum radiatum TaxID=300843 RepID=A0AAW2QEF0_SESRA
MSRWWHPFPPCLEIPCGDPSRCCYAGYKVEWPELLGQEGEVAKGIIMKENPLVTPVIVPNGDAVTHDFCCNRVWIWVDEKKHVKHVPKVG